MSAPAQLPHTQLPPQARRLEKFHPDLGNDNMNDIPNTEVGSTAFTGTSAAFSFQYIMQFAMLCAIQWNPNVLVKGKELPTQNPPLPL